MGWRQRKSDDCLPDDTTGFCSVVTPLIIWQHFLCFELHFNRDSWAWRIVIIKKRCSLLQFSVWYVLSSALIQKLVPSPQRNKQTTTKEPAFVLVASENPHNCGVCPKENRLVVGDDPQNFLWAAPSRKQGFSLHPFSLHIDGSLHLLMKKKKDGGRRQRP